MNVGNLLNRDSDVITRNYFMSVIHHRLDGSQYFNTATMAITSFFPKEINLVRSYLNEELITQAGKDSPTKDAAAPVQIIAFNRI